MAATVSFLGKSKVQDRMHSLVPRRAWRRASRAWCRWSA